jgi:predicted transcriptional regulator
MPTRVLLSVKPSFAEAILAGVKKFEFRRVLFRRQDIKTVVLYASRPTCKVVGEFTLDEILSLDPDALWRATAGEGAIDREYLTNIFRGSPRVMRSR